LKIKITKDCAALFDWDTLMQNAKETYTAEFIFDETWEGFSKTAVFVAGPVSVSVPLREDRCQVPPRCLKWGGVVLMVGVRGEKGLERKNAGWCRAGKVLHEAFSGSAAPSTSVPDLPEEVLAVIGDLAAAGFQGTTVTDALCEIRSHLCQAAADEEVDAMLDDVFGE